MLRWPPRASYWEKKTSSAPQALISKFWHMKQLESARLCSVLLTCSLEKALQLDETVVRDLVVTRW